MTPTSLQEFLAQLEASEAERVAAVDALLIPGPWLTIVRDGQRVVVCEGSIDGGRGEEWKGSPQEDVYIDVATVPVGDVLTAEFIAQSISIVPQQQAEIAILRRVVAKLFEQRDARPVYGDYGDLPSARAKADWIAQDNAALDAIVRGSP